MENFLLYIGKSALAAGAFYLVYLALFQNQKQFTFNRIYLPVSLAVSFVIPLITFTKIRYLDAAPVSAKSMAFLPEINQVNQADEFQFEWLHYLFGIYIAGAFGFLSFLILGHVKAISIVKKSQLKKLFEIKVNITKNDVHPFSFFHKIVLSKQTLDNPNLKLIVEHENIHVKEKHTFDILFSELMFLLQWFNPFAWLIKDAIKNNLEYKTDQKLTETHNPQAYQLAMVGLADKKGVAPFLTALNGTQLKKRIIMMKKKTENKYAIVKQLVVLPLLAVLVMGLSNREVKTEFVPTENQVEILSGEKVIKGKVTDDKGKPLYVVDGESVGNIDSINPDDIESVSVLKDKSATDLYGKKGKNGVIVVTTKKSGSIQKGELPVVLNGKLTQLTLKEVDRDLIQNIKRIEPEEAIKKYGEKGENGVFEITSRNVYTDKVKVKSSEEPEKEKITSELELRKFIAKKIKYPTLATETNTEETINVAVKFDKNGKIKQISENDTNLNIYKKADFMLDEVVVIAYSKVKKGTENPNQGKVKTTEEDPLTLLANEVKRVIELIPEIDIPEFKNKTVGITVKFELQD